MAAGEYVSVHSQSDTEHADLELERAELKTDDKGEHKELAAIYVARGLDSSFAEQVPEQLMRHDAIGAHARDELGISDTFRARPIQAALASAGSFAVGAAMPLLVTALAPTSVTCEGNAYLVRSVWHKLTRCAEKLKADTLGEDVGLHLLIECASGGTHPHAFITPPKIRTAAPLPLEQFLSPDPLAVVAVPNLEPRRLPVKQVRPLLPLGDNSFEVVFALQPEPPFTIVFDVVAVQDAVASLRHDRPEPQLTAEQRQVPQVLAIVPEHVEGVEAGFPTPEQEVLEPLQVNSSHRACLCDITQLRWLPPSPLSGSLN